MADSKISALPAVVTPAGTDEFAVNQGGTSKKVTLSQFNTLQQTFDLGQSITIADTDNQTLSLTNNDTTNNQNAFEITDTTTGDSIEITKNVADGIALDITRTFAGSGTNSSTILAQVDLTSGTQTAELECGEFQLSYTGTAITDQNPLGGGATIAALQGITRYDSTANTTGAIFGGGNLIITGENTAAHGDVALANGLYNVVRMAGTGTVTEGTAGFFGVITQAAGTSTDIKGLNIQNVDQSGATHTLTNEYGVDITTMGIGTGGETVGINIADVGTTNTSNIAIKTSGGQIQFNHAVDEEFINISNNTGATASGVLMGLGSDGLTTGSSVEFNSNSNDLSSGVPWFKMFHQPSAITADFTGSGMFGDFSRTLTAATTRNDGGAIFELDLKPVVNNAGATFNVATDIINIEYTGTETAGTLSFTGDALGINVDGDGVDAGATAINSFIAFDAGSGTQTFGHSFTTDIDSGTQSALAVGALQSLKFNGSASASGTSATSTAPIGLFGGLNWDSTGTCAEGVGVVGYYSVGSGIANGLVSQGSGVAGVVLHQGTGTITTAVGLAAQVFTLNPAATITNGIGINVQVADPTTLATITNAIGLNIAAISQGATANVGIDIAAISGGSAAYSIRTAGGEVEITDSTITTGELLDVNGNAITTGDVINVDSATLTTGKLLHMSGTSTGAGAKAINSSFSTVGSGTVQEAYSLGMVFGSGTQTEVAESVVATQSWNGSVIQNTESASAFSGFLEWNSTGTASDLGGSIGTVAIAGIANGTVDFASGISGSVEHGGTGTVTNSVAGYFELSYEDAGTTTNSYGTYVSFVDDSGSTHTWTNQTGMFVEDVTLGATLNIGVDIGEVSGATTNWALRTSTSGGDVSLGGKVVHAGITTSSGAGAIAVTGSSHEITTTGTGDALTLANGTAGQRLTIVYVAEGAGADTAVLTPTTLAGGTTITFNNLGDACTLEYHTTGGWYVVGINGAVVA